jgi:hypothetical protein
MTAPARITPTSLGGLKLARVADMAPRINGLIYGEPGVGKTVLLGSCDAVPEMRKMLILDVDGGTLSIKDSYPNVERLQITKFAQLQRVYDDLFNDAGHGFQTVAIDTGTEAQKINMNVIMAKAVAAAADKGEVRDPEVPSFREWGISGEQMRGLIRAYRDLPMNFFMTCHVKDDKNEQTGAVKKSPDLPGKLARQIPGFFDLCLYMYSKEIEKDGEKKDLRLLCSAATEKIVAKDRSAKLPKIIQQANMKYIYTTVTSPKKEIAPVKKEAVTV